VKKILPLLLFLLVALPAHAQANLDQLTRLGDINAYAFSPDGENIYFTRPARVIELSSTRAQTINNLYRASIADQAVVQLASNANFFAVAPNGQKIAYLEFQDATHTRLRTLDLSTGKISDAGPADWGIAPMWTQDSTRVVFSRGQRATLKSVGATPDSRVCFIPARGSHCVQRGRWFALCRCAVGRRCVRGKG
jgi:Tol biopolymer transport system component